MKNNALVVSVIAVACGGTQDPAQAPDVPLEVPPMPAPAASPPMHVEPEPPRPSRGPVDRVRAESAFREGRDAFARGDLALARTKFEESYAAEPVAGTVLNLAEVESRLGDVLNARRHYQEAYDRSVAEGRHERASFAKGRLDALGP